MGETICVYCTPNKQGQCKPLNVEKFYMRGFTLNRHKRNTLKIYRKRQNKRKYFLGIHSLDVSDDGHIWKNNGFKVQKEINFCPMCGRDLQVKTLKKLKEND